MDLRPYLNLQSDRIEALLTAHRAPGKITGGTAGPRVIRLFCKPASTTKLAQIQALADDLALALEVESLRVAALPEKGGICLEFPNPAPRPVRLADMLSMLGKPQEAVCALGMLDDGTPLAARLPSPDVAHMLVSGTTGSGKTVLLKSIVASLWETGTALLLIDPKARSFAPFQGGPLARPVLVEATEAAAALGAAVSMMEERDQRGVTGPKIVIVIDEVADLVMGAGGDAIEKPLARLLQRGREAGLHVIAATQRPSAAIITGLMKANFPLRLVGRVTSADEARIATGQAGTGAERLLGRGDFLAVSGARLIRFQAAQAADGWIEALVARTFRNPCPVTFPASAPIAPVEEPEPVCKLARLAGILGARAREEGRRWGSVTEAAQWIYGDGKGTGDNWYTAREVVAWIDGIERDDPATNKPLAGPRPARKSEKRAAPAA